MWSASRITARCSIGDTLTEGEDIVFRGVPSFAPEILRRIKLQDAMKAKKLREALQQMAEEGVVQLFLPYDGSGAIVGVVGALQLDVLKERLLGEYGLPIDYETTRFSLCRWIASRDRAELDRFVEAHGSAMARDLDGAPVFMAATPFSLKYEQDRWKAIAIFRREGLPEARRGGVIAAHPGSRKARAGSINADGVPYGRRRRRPFNRKRRVRKLRFAAPRMTGRLTPPSCVPQKAPASSARRRGSAGSPRCRDAGSHRPTRRARR